MFIFYVENHEHFGSLTKNCPKLDKNKSIYSVQIFSICVVYKSAVSTVQKSNCRMFQFSSFDVCICTSIFPDISIKSTKLHFQSWKKVFSNDFALFP